jgi:hypothetical protein
MTIAPDLYIETAGRRDRVLDFASIPAIAPGQRLVFRWQLQQPQLTPGRYRIDVSPRMTDDAGRTVAPLASILDFEVRDLLTSQAVATLALRKGARAFLDGNMEQAISTVDELLRMNPRSYAALMLKGTVVAKTDRPAAVQPLAHRTRNRPCEQRPMVCRMCRRRLSRHASRYHAPSCRYKSD